MHRGQDLHLGPLEVMLRQTWGVCRVRQERAGRWIWGTWRFTDERMLFPGGRENAGLALPYREIRAVPRCGLLGPVTILLWSGECCRLWTPWPQKLGALIARQMARGK